jgi:hypothetical protein
MHNTSRHNCQFLNILVYMEMMYTDIGCDYIWIENFPLIYAVWRLWYTAELQLSGRWLPESPIIRIGMAIRLNIFLLYLYYILYGLNFFP